MPSSDTNSTAKRKSDLELRLDAVLTEMAGYPGTPPTQRALAFLVCDGTSAPQTFNKIVKGVNTASRDVLYALHHALRLQEIGVAFDVGLWRPPYTTEALKACVRQHRQAKAHEPIITRVTGRLALFGFNVYRSRVFVPLEDKGPSYADPLPRTAFREGEEVQVWIDAPIDGYVKLMSIEKSDIIGLDTYFGLSHKRFCKGERVTLEPAFRVQPDPAEALFVAIMQPQRYGPSWPTDHRGPHMSEAQLAELARSLPIDTPIWAHRVFVIGGDQNG